MATRGQRTAGIEAEMQPVPAERNVSASSQGAESSTLTSRNLRGNSALLGAAAAGLLAVATASVGLLTFTSEPVQQKTSEQTVETGGASLVRHLADAESERAIARLMMSAPEKQKVRAEVAEGKLRLASITVSDSYNDRGDWVRVAAAGFQQDVHLLREPYTMSVPYLPGMPISIIGLVDSCGCKITVAVYSGSAQLSLKPLKPGEVVQISAPRGP